MSRSVCVIGGRGKFGGLIARMFTDAGCDVTILGRDNKDAWPKVLSSADVVIVSVPISATAEVIAEVRDLVPSGALLADVTSVKDMPMREMLKAPEEVGVVGLHPLFGPLVTNMKGQRIVVTRGRDNDHVGFVIDVFADRGARIIEMAPEEHDKKMAVVQTLTHFVNFVYTETMLAHGSYTDDISTPPSRIQTLLGAHVTGNSGELYADIEMFNGFSHEVLTSALDSAREWFELVTNGDREGFTKKYDRLKHELDDFIPIAQKTIVQMGSIIDTQPTETRRRAPLSSDTDVSVITLGPEGTFSHEAVQEVYGTQADIVFEPTITSVFERVFSDEGVVGVVPIENSTQGIVQETLDALLKYPVQTFGSYTHPVHLYLLGRTTRMEDITHVKSHPQPLHQSRNWLQKNLPDAVLETESSSIKAIVSAKDTGTAFVASKNAAETHGLEILAEQIEDKKDNKTEFYLIAKEPSGELVERHHATRTALLLVIHDRPGILRDILDVFAVRGINLTKLHSKTSDMPGHDYYFFLELDGLPTDDSMRGALTSIEEFCYIVRVLGAV